MLLQHFEHIYTPQTWLSTLLQGLEKALELALHYEADSIHVLEMEPGYFQLGRLHPYWKYTFLCFISSMDATAILEI